MQGVRLAVTDQNLMVNRFYFFRVNLNMFSLAFRAMCVFNMHTGPNTRSPLNPNPQTPKPLNPKPLEFVKPLNPEHLNPETSNP